MINLLIKSIRKITKKIIILMMCINSFIFSVSAIDTSDEFKQFIEELEANHSNMQGSAVAILKEGEVIYKKTFGYTKKGGSPINHDTLFGLASLAKPVSALAIGLIVDKNLLNFEDKITLPYMKHQVALSNILGHTTGYKVPGDAEIEKGLTRPQLLQILSIQEPKCVPGKCYSYSNAIFSLVEEAVSIQGFSYSDLISNLSAAINTQGIKLLPLKPNENIAYQHSKNQLLPFPSLYQKNVPSAAGVFASLNGIVEFYKLSFGYRPDLISQKTLDQIYKPIMLNDDLRKWNINFPFEASKIKSYYGLGWRILKVDDNLTADLIFHSGYIHGVKTFIGYIPYKKVGIIIMSSDQRALPVTRAMIFWEKVVKNKII